MLLPIPLKQFTKHKKLFILVFLVVVFICHLQFSFHHTNDHDSVQPNGKQRPRLTDPIPATRLETVEDVPREKTSPDEVIPNLHAMLNIDIEYKKELPVNQCKPPNYSERGSYQANITYLNLARAERVIFRNLTDRVRSLTKEANELLQRLTSERGAVDAPSDQLYHGKRVDDVRRGQIGVDVGTHVYYPGGHWIPRNCVSRWKVAIVIPYRNRSENLHTLLRNLVPFLLNQRLEFGIYIAEQGFSEVMNRGLMRNIGYQLARGSGTHWDCFIFHDVDYVPMNATNYYGCDRFPMHYAVKLEEFNYDNPYLVDFGGVVGLTGEQMDQINGYSNMYWGWGGEDDDVKRRLKSRQYNISHSHEGYYRDLPHRKKAWHETCMERFCLVKYAFQRMSYDGLSAISYDHGANISLTTLYTNISVDVEKNSWNYGYPKCRIFSNKNIKPTAIICVFIYGTFMLIIFTCAFIGFSTHYPPELPGPRAASWDGGSGRQPKVKKLFKYSYRQLPAKESI